MEKILQQINTLYSMSKENQEIRPVLLKAARLLLKHVDYLLLDVAELSEHELNALKHCKKIEAIKFYMNRTGKGLKESKDFIETQMQNLFGVTYFK